ncbi:3-oxoadipate enol-lactonase [Pseudahrensia aquimaris]|uniref:3-oxoadipate enol-lactonase n=1 Tax=Pseudahrensia aquimaris TaxID=744461 RepID=A0ABW3FGC1_9HYPH
MQFSTINGVSIHHQVIAGPDEKPTIVFSNSLGTDFRIWRDVIIRLVGEASVIMYDKRGHGLSGTGPGNSSIEDHAADLAGLLDHLGVNDAVICGLSVGGLIAQMLYRERPDLVKALILCDTAAKIGTDEIWNERIESIRAGGMASATQGVMERWFTKPFLGTEEIKGYATMFERQPLEGYLETAAAIRDCDLRADALEIKVPTICIVGDDDRATTPELVAGTAKLIPDCRYEIIKGAGHLPCVEQPEMLVEIINAFLKDASVI